MFTPKYVPYQMHDSSLLEQSRCRTTTFGLRSLSYIGAKLWNNLPNDFKATTDFADFTRCCKRWQVQILMTLSAFMYQSYLILHTNYKLYMFLISSHGFYDLRPCLHVHRIVYRPATRRPQSHVPQCTVLWKCAQVCTSLLRGGAFVGRLSGALWNLWDGSIALS